MIKHTYHYNDEFIYIAKMLVENEGDAISGAGYVNFPPPDDDKFGEYKLVDNKWESFINVAQIKSSVSSAITRSLNTFSKTRGYPNIETACSYSNSTIDSFKSDANFCITIRDSTWIAYFDILKKIESGSMQMFTSYDDIKSQLPKLEWPKD